VPLTKFDTRQYRAALASADPLMELREIIRHELQRDPRARPYILDGLEDLRAELRAEGLTDAEDTVLEVMDFMTGWSSPHMRI
jgi:hypothetical protein